MYSFLVLGIVPGTNIQITFEGWALISLSLAGLILLGKFALLQLNSASEHTGTTHQAVHASQLHNRLLSA